MLIRQITLLTLGCWVLHSSAQTPALLSSNQAPCKDFLASDIDASVDPGKDFFQYANGSWLGRNPIPASEAAWGIGNLVDEELYAKLRKINEDAAKSQAPAGTDRQKIGDFWTAAMDEVRADSLGLAPLKAQLALIDSIKTVQNVLDVSFALRPLSVDAFCGVYVSQDEKQSDVMSVHIDQGGLGLPERNFYFNKEKGIAQIRKEYVAHLTRMLKLLGHSDKDSLKAAQNIMKFETALAKASRKLEDLRDPEKNYNKMSPANLTSKHTKLIDWDSRLSAMSLHTNYVIVGQPEFFTALNRLLAKTPIPVLKDYLRVRLVSDYAEYLGRTWDDEDFSFSGKVLSGQKEQRPRWKRVLDSQGHAMGMVLGKIFVQEYFPPAAKKRYVALVEAIRTAYRERITRLDWMSDATKAKAQEKLAKMTSKVGYPDKWKDYSTLVISTNSYCENMMNSARWHWNDMVSKFGKPVDRKEWHMTPQTYNAYYEPANNEIVLPAAIFTVPGFRDDELDDALVYGYSGASTIGHEITHGFDDEGRQFDSAGNLKDWWTPQDAARFKKQSDVMVAQFNTYEPLPGLHINGRASLGENLADYGGLLLGLDAFKKTEQYRQGAKINGLTPNQRYFLGYALGWLHHEREERLRRGLLSDVHAPAKWRVIGPLSNIPDFYQAFGIKPGQPMWRPPESHVSVW
jgi:putative endopeptidase